MSRTQMYWTLIVLLALGTWLLRAVPIMLHGRVKPRPWTERLLRYVPVAALTALVVPGALYTHTDSAYEFAPARLAAMIVALLVALRTKSALATLAVGMGVLWAVQAGLAALS
jgi:branched-subunit amino acid transport protein